MNIDKKNLAIQILAVLGLILSIELACIYYHVNFLKDGGASFCSINQFIDCDGAAKTNVSQFIGIPLAWWGIGLYLVILFLTFVDKLKNIKYLGFLDVFKEPKAYITTLSGIAFICSMILAGISIFGIHKLCLLCFVTYFIDLAIALTASSASFKNIIGSVKTTVLDFIAGAKKYTAAFIALVLLFAGVLTYSGTTFNFVPHLKFRKEILKYQKIKYNPYRVKGNTLGNKNGDVVIELYSDFVCPLCYIHNIMLHQAAKEFKNLKIVHHNYPFDTECNPYVTFKMHPNACFMSKGVIAARKQGNYWEMSSLLYENQPKKMDDMIKLAEKLNFDVDAFRSDFYSKETFNEISNELKAANQRGIDATPTMIINNKKYVGVKPYSKLKDILIENGAKTN